MPEKNPSFEQQRASAKAETERRHAISRSLGLWKNALRKQLAAKGTPEDEIQRQLAPVERLCQTHELSVTESLVPLLETFSDREEGTRFVWDEYGFGGLGDVRFTLTEIKKALKGLEGVEPAEVPWGDANDDEARKRFTKRIRAPQDPRKVALAGLIEEFRLAQKSFLVELKDWEARYDAKVADLAQRGIAPPDLRGRIEVAPQQLEQLERTVEYLTMRGALEREIEEAGVDRPSGLSLKDSQETAQELRAVLEVARANEKLIRDSEESTKEAARGHSSGSAPGQAAAPSSGSDLQRFLTPIAQRSTPREEVTWIKGTGFSLELSAGFRMIEEGDNPSPNRTTKYFKILPPGCQSVREGGVFVSSGSRRDLLLTIEVGRYRKRGTKSLRDPKHLNLTLYGLFHYAPYNSDCGEFEIAEVIAVSDPLKTMIDGRPVQVRELEVVGHPGTFRLMFVFVMGKAAAVELLFLIPMERLETLLPACIGLVGRLDMVGGLIDLSV